MSDAIPMKTVDLQVQSLLDDLHNLKLPDIVKSGLLDDLQLVTDINGDPDRNQQMSKRILFSICRNSVQNHKQRAEDVEKHQKDCVIAAAVTYDDAGKPIMPWTSVSKDGRNVEHEAWDANGRETRGRFKEKLRGVVLDNARLIIICVTVIISALATRTLPSLGDIVKALATPLSVSDPAETTTTKGG